MEELEVYDKLSAIATPQVVVAFGGENDHAIKVAEHKSWLASIRHEKPSPAVPFKVGIYIRYFNQTRYENYLEFHKKQFADTIALCKNWTLVDFYIDEGASPPHMETAPDWSRLVNDAMDGKVDLIITQKVSNVSKKMAEVTFCARALAAQDPPIGIYFISEDIFTLASYYREDLRDTFFLPDNGIKALDNASTEISEDTE